MSKEIIADKIEELSGGEFERTPVPQSRLKGWKSFIGMYAGEHAAGTEFMIGPLFLTAGVSAFDLIIGLLLGNLLAVLSWRFLTAEIAVKNRLTLYYQLEKICGKKLVTGYNLANGILFCFLAGSMITVSATAVGIPFDMPMPKLDDTLPNGMTWIIIVILIGAVISLIAARGYDTVTKAANWMSPIIVLAFIACGIVALSQLGVSSFSEFWAIGVKEQNLFLVKLNSLFGMLLFGLGLLMVLCILVCQIYLFFVLQKKQKQVGQQLQECMLGIIWPG